MPAIVLCFLSYLIGAFFTGIGVFLLMTGSFWLGIFTMLMTFLIVMAMGLTVTGDE